MANMTRGFDPFMMFDDLFAPGPSAGSVAGWQPAVDIHETGEAAFLQMEVPGIKSEQISIEVDGRHLTVRGEKAAAADGEGCSICHRERRYGQFERTFELGFQVDRDRIEAACEQGVLTIRLPKSEAAKARRIEVRAG